MRFSKSNDSAFNHFYHNNKVHIKLRIRTSTLHEAEPGSLIHKGIKSPICHIHVASIQERRKYSSNGHGRMELLVETTQTQPTKRIKVRVSFSLSSCSSIAVFYGLLVSRLRRQRPRWANMAFEIKALPFTFVAHALAIVGAVLVLVWCIHFRGGLAWESSNKSLIFNVRFYLFRIVNSPLFFWKLRSLSLSPGLVFFFDFRSIVSIRIKGFCLVVRL